MCTCSIAEVPVLQQLCFLVLSVTFVLLYLAPPSTHPCLSDLICSCSLPCLLLITTCMTAVMLGDSRPCMVSQKHSPCPQGTSHLVGWQEHAHWLMGKLGAVWWCYLEMCNLKRVLGVDLSEKVWDSHRTGFGEQSEGMGFFLGWGDGDDWRS